MATSSAASVKFTSRMKSGLHNFFVNKAGVFIKQLLQDYKTATLDVFGDAKARPIKAAFYITSLSGIIYCATQNPDFDSFNDAVVTAANDLLQLSPVVRNPSPNSHVQRIMNLRNIGTVRRMNLGVCSIIWEDNYSNDLGMYHAVCKHLKVGWKEFPDRIIDIGFLGRWFILEREMIDYDINPDEWETTGS